MNKPLMKLLAIGLLVVGLCVMIFTTAMYHHSFEEEKLAHAASKEEVKRLKTIIKANKENQPERLNEIASKFIDTLFYSNGKNLKKKNKELKEMTTAEARKNMFENEDDEEHIHEDPLHGIEEFESSATILETFYNRSNEREAIVTLKFEHSIESKEYTTKTLNEAKVKLLYVDGKWLVNKYDITEIM